MYPLPRQEFVLNPGQNLRQQLSVVPLWVAASLEDLVELAQALIHATRIEAHVRQSRHVELVLFQRS
jgi:hypothetical protein